tara:strand:- start:180 stop:707 length:528 start_codon:yes stop_codon:yes gene_type:complete
MKIIDKLSTYAALIGVVSAIGGGFYAWGEFNTRLSAIENEPPINLTPLKNGLKETNNNLSEAKIDLIDRIKKVEDKIEPQDLTWILRDFETVRKQIENLNIPEATDLTKVFKDIALVSEEIVKVSAKIPQAVNLKPLIKAIQELEKALAIVQKENQVQDAMIEEIKLKANNPLAN